MVRNKLLMPDFFPSNAMLSVESPKRSSSYPLKWELLREENGSLFNGATSPFPKSFFRSEKINLPLSKLSGKVILFLRSDRIGYGLSANMLDRVRSD